MPSSPVPTEPHHPDGNPEPPVRVYMPSARSHPADRRNTPPTRAAAPIQSAPDPLPPAIHPTSPTPPNHHTALADPAVLTESATARPCAPATGTSTRPAHPYRQSTHGRRPACGP